MENAIILLILAVTVGGALMYMHRAKKRGEKCVGCPYAKQCSGSCAGTEETEDPRFKVKRVS